MRLGIKLSASGKKVFSIPSYRIDYLPERYNEYNLRPTKLTLEENNRDMKELNLIQIYKR